MICLQSGLLSPRSVVWKGCVALAFALIGLPIEANCQQSFPPNPATIQGPSESSLATATESVNNSNGNVSVSIPLLHLPGVSGLDLNLNLAYDSKHYDAIGIGTPGVSASMQWGGANTFDPDFGKFGTLSIPRLNSDNIDVDSIDVGLDEPAIISCDTNFQFRDADGSVHAFDNAINCYQSNSGIADSGRAGRRRDFTMPRSSILSSASEISVRRSANRASGQRFRPSKE